VSGLFAGVLGQESAVDTLCRALAQDRVAHAYLFEGPSGVGKAKAALALACALTCTEAPRLGCGACPTCTRVQAGKHPDVRIFTPRDEGNRNLPVEVVREDILPFTKFAPFEAAGACLIFPEADVSFPVQHAEAANAMLKTLEEPRARVTFILLSERPDRLLPTIRSRAQTVRFTGLRPALLRSILSQHGVAETAQDAAIALAQGSADRAIALAEEGRAERLLDTVLRADAAVADRRIGAVLDLADEIAGSDERHLLLDTLALFYRDVATLALIGPAAVLSFPQRAELIASRADMVGARRAAERVQTIDATREALGRNANPETALDAMLFSFA